MSDPSKIDVSIVKHFRVPAERVFDTWLSPALIRRWFGPGLGEMTRVEVEPRKGGAFFFYQQREHGVAQHSGEYRIVDRPHCLAFTWQVGGMSAVNEISVAFLATDTGCKIKLTHQIDAEFANYVDATRKGWSIMLDAMELALADPRPVEAFPHG